MNYITLLRESQTVRILTAVQTIAYFGSWFSHVAILTLLAQLGAGAFVISLAVSMAFLPSLIQGPFTGALVDRLEPKKLMNTLLMIEAVCTFLFVFFDAREYIWLLLALVYIKMSAASFYFTSEMSLLPKVLKSSELKLANELHSIVWSVSFTAGTALGGLAVRYIGMKAAFLTDATLFILAVIVFSKLGVNIEKVKQSVGYIESFKDGMRYVFKQKPKLLIFIALHASVGLTVFDGVVTVLAEHQYKNIISVALAIGFIGSVRSLALIFGPFLFSKFINKERFFWLFVGQGAAIMLWGMLSHDFLLSLVGAFFCGLFTTTIWSYSMTLLQESIDKEYYGRVVSINDMFFTATATITSLGIGIAMEAGVSGGGALFILGVLFILVALFYKAVVSRLDVPSQK